jgi:hypothetical protein
LPTLLKALRAVGAALFSSSCDHYDIYWLAVLAFVTMPMALLSAVLQYEFQERQHKPLCFVNEILARFQIGFFTFFFAILVATDLARTGRLAIIGLATWCLVAMLRTAKFASPAFHREALSRYGHTCTAPYPPPKCTLPRKGRLRIMAALCWRNLAFFVGSFLAALLLPFCLAKPDLAGSNKSQYAPPAIATIDVTTDEGSDVCIYPVAADVSCCPQSSGRTDDCIKFSLTSEAGPRVVAPGTYVIELTNQRTGKLARRTEYVTGTRRLRYRWSTGEWH